MSYWTKPANYNKQIVRELSIDKIVIDVCKTYNVSLEDIQSRKQAQRYVRPRHVLSYILFRKLFLTQREASDIIKRNKSNIEHSSRAIEDAMFAEYETREIIESILSRNDYFRYKPKNIRERGKHKYK